MTPPRRIAILGVSGSLRAGSSNAAVLRATAGLAGETMDFTIYKGLEELPHFNPDLDDESRPPGPVRELRVSLAHADGIVISTPEYAHGVPGSLKNALDWIVSSGELRGKPILLINASPGGGEYAQASLTETLQVMEARVLEGATVRVASIRSKLDGEGHVSEAGTVKALETGLAALVSAIEGA